MDRAGSKRKRSTFHESSHPPSRLPSETINPLSHTPSTLSQFLVAGLTDSNEIPSKILLDFPHRPWQDSGIFKKRNRRRSVTSVMSSGVDTDEDTDGRATSTDGETEPETDAESTTSLPKAKSYAAERAALRPLARSIAVFLSQDNIPAAKRAFGLLMRSKISGKKVDIRRNHYWEMGAEILMRERPLEDRTQHVLPMNDDEKKDSTKPQNRPVYPVANVPRVKKYFEDLILQFPHHLTARRAASALQFHPALLSYEIYQLHAQHVYHMKQIYDESESWELEPAEETHVMDRFGPEESDLGMEDDPDPFLRTGRRFESPSTARDNRLRHAKDEIREQTLDSLRVMAQRIDQLLEDSAFAMSGEILRLAGIVSLFAAELTVPMHTDGPGHREAAERQRETEREKARGFFTRAMQRKVVIEAPIREALGMEQEDDDEEPAPMPTFSSLPIRDHRD